VAELFPFKGYFIDTPAPLFGGRSFEAVSGGEMMREREKEERERKRGCV
jgi:hypothetical protein